MIGRFFLTLALSALSVSAAELRLGPDGDVRTPSDALKRIREERKSGRLDALEKASVLCAPGVYELTDSLVLMPDDSNVEFIGSEDGRTVFSAGRELPPFSVGADRLWHVTVPDSLSFDQLWVGGRRAERAKSPDAGYHFIRRQACGDGRDPLTGAWIDLCSRAFFADPEDVRPLAGLPPDKLTNVLVRVYLSWETAIARVVGIDAKTGLVITESGYPGWRDYGLDPYKTERLRFEFENFRTGLTQPGEWFHDRQKREVIYWPRPGETTGSVRGTVPTAASVVVLKGTSANPVRNVTFRNVAFEHAGYAYPRRVCVGQAAATVGAAVEADFAEGVRLEGCRIEHVALHGIWFRRGCRECAAVSCRLSDLGAGGVYIGPADRKWDVVRQKGEEAKGVVVEDCIISGGGHVYPEGIGVALFLATDCRIEHNDICDFRYTGVSCGWNWRFEPTTNARNSISFNHIRNVGLETLSDLGGIYTLGESKDSVVLGNWIHDIAAYNHNGYGSWGLYSDEGSSYYSYVSNLVYKAKTGAAFQHLGRELCFEGNVYLKSPGGEIGTDPRYAFWRENAGVRGDAAWRQAASSLVPRRAVRPRDIRSREDVDVFSSGFEGFVRGKIPGAPFAVNGGGADPARYGVVRVVEDAAQARNGRRFLELKDAQGLAAAYLPHLSLGCPTGGNGLRLRFSVRPADGKGDFRFELRDRGHPDANSTYSVGVALKVSEGRLTVNGKPLCAMPSGEWTDIGIDVRYADEPEISVVARSSRGGDRASETLKPQSVRFRKASVFEMFAPGEESATLWVDDVAFVQR